MLGTICMFAWGGWVWLFELAGLFGLGLGLVGFAVELVVAGCLHV